MVTPKHTVGITPGTEGGVGPELLVTALSRNTAADAANFYWCGDRASLMLAATRAQVGLNFLSDTEARLPNDVEIRFSSANFGDDPKKRAAKFLEHSVKLVHAKEIHAIVTGPIEKSSLAYLPEGPFAGQTEYFAAHLKKEGQKPMMTFMGGPYMLSLLTTHIPLSAVSEAIKFQTLVDHFMALAAHASRALEKHISDINIVVLGLNPHAGEQGLLGSEEMQIISPAIKYAKSAGLNVEGPVPTDGFFAYFHRLKKVPDAVVALYHDQGLGTYKLLARGHAVNVTLGLTIPRTSPAHGTAMELTGQQIACPRSTENALNLAIKLARIMS